MDINIIQDLLYIIPRLTKIKFVYREDSKMIYWRFCRGHMYMYKTTNISASVDEIHSLEELETSFHTYLLDQKGILRVKYLEGPPDEYEFT